MDNILHKILDMYKTPVNTSWPLVGTWFNHDIMIAEAAGSARMQSNCSGEKLLTAKLLVFFVAFISWTIFLTEKDVEKVLILGGSIVKNWVNSGTICFFFVFGGVRNANQTTLLQCCNPHSPPKKKNVAVLPAGTLHPEDVFEIQ